MIDDLHLDPDEQEARDAAEKKRIAHLLDAANEDAYGSGYGEDGRWLPRECVVCFAETQLRCSVCRHAVCHNCAECPNGCDSVNRA